VQYLALGVAAVILLGLYLLTPRKYQRSIAVLAFAAVGAFVGLTPLELGILGLSLAGCALVAVISLPGSASIRLERVGGYLIGAGGAGVVLLLSIVVRIKNVCGSGGVFGTGGSVSGSAGGNSLASTIRAYECYSRETLTAVVLYAAFICLGLVLMLVARRKPAQSLELPMTTV